MATGLIDPTRLKLYVNHDSNYLSHRRDYDASAPYAYALPARPLFPLYPKPRNFYYFDPVTEEERQRRAKEAEDFKGSEAEDEANRKAEWHRRRKVAWLEHAEWLDKHKAMDGRFRRPDLANKPPEERRFHVAAAEHYQSVVHAFDQLSKEESGVCKHVARQGLQEQHLQCHVCHKRRIVRADSLSRSLKTARFRCTAKEGVSCAVPETKDEKELHLQSQMHELQEGLYSYGLKAKKKAKRKARRAAESQQALKRVKVLLRPEA